MNYYYYYYLVFGVFLIYILYSHLHTIISFFSVCRCFLVCCVVDIDCGVGIVFISYLVVELRQYLALLHFVGALSEEIIV